MKIKKYVVYAFVMAAVIVCFAGCAENPGVQGGDFAERDSLSDSFSLRGNTTVTLSRDETLDLTGIELIGRKEVFLNNYTLKLTGSIAVSEEGVIDIKPGDGFLDGAIDLSELKFDFPGEFSEYPGDMAIIEIRSGVNIIEPEADDRITIRDFGVLISINVYNP